MSIGEVTAIIIACVAIAGVIITFVSYGRQNAGLVREKGERQGQLDEKVSHMESDLKDVKEAVTSPVHGLPAIRSDINAMKQYCAGTTVSFNGRLKSLEAKGGKR